MSEHQGSRQLPGVSLFAHGVSGDFDIMHLLRRAKAIRYGITARFARVAGIAEEFLVLTFCREARMLKNPSGEYVL